MANAIATLSMKLIADTHGFDLGDVRKDLAFLKKTVQDTAPELEVYSRRVKVLGEMWEAGAIDAAEYGRAVKHLEANLSHNLEAERAAAEELRTIKQRQEQEQREAERAAAERQRKIERDTQKRIQLAREEMAAMNALSNKWRDFAKTDIDKWNERARELLSVRMTMSRSEFRKAWEKLKQSDPRIVTAEVVEAVNPFGEVRKNPLAQFGRDQLAMRLPIAGDLTAAGAAAGPAGIAVTAALASMAAGAYATTKAVSLLSSTVLGGIEQLNALADQAQVLGISASSLDRLTLAADIGGSRVESMTSALEKMETLLGDPSDDLVKTLEGLNLDVSALQQMRADRAFEAIAQAIAGVGDRSKQLAIITEVFGKGNRDLVNYIDNLDEANATAERLRLSDAQFVAITKADDALRDMRLEMERLTKTLSAELAPIVVEIGGLLKDVLQSDVTQSGLYTGIAAIRATLDGAADSARTLGEIIAANQTVQNAGLVGGLLADPFSQLGDATRRGIELDKSRDARQRQQEQDARLQSWWESHAPDASMTDAIASMVDQQAEADKRRADALAELRRQVAEFGNEELAARNRAIESGAVTQQQIEDYLQAWRELRTLQEQDRQSKQDAQDAERERLQREQRVAELADSFMSPRDKALKDIRDAAAIGVGGDLMNQLIDRTARGLLPNTVDQRVGVVEKGSQEAARAATQRNKETRQEKLLQEIRDLLRRAGNREPLTVEELAIN